MNFSFCESVHAGPSSPWHLRRLTVNGRKLGGGIDTRSLCSAVEVGWDLAVEITEHHLSHACPRCVSEYRRITKEITDGGTDDKERALRPRVAELEAALAGMREALQSCRNLTRLQERSPTTVRSVGETVGVIVTAALATDAGKARSEADRALVRAAQELVGGENEFTLCIVEPPCGNCPACRFQAALDAHPLGKE